MTNEIGRTLGALAGVRWCSRRLAEKYHGLRRRLRRVTRHLNRDPHLRIYYSMRKDNRAAAPVYRAGNFWESINRNFEDLLYQGALPHLRDGYFNRAFAGPEPESRQVYRALLWLYYNKLLHRDRYGFLETLLDPAVGGTADQEVIGGRPMTLDLLQSTDEAFGILEAWRSSGRLVQPRVLVELGAGYGRLGHVWLKLVPNCSYVVLDLPEALLCSSFWLDRVFPGAVVSYDESRMPGTLTRERLITKRIWTLGAHQIEQLAPGSVDVFVNIYSFAEMTPAAICNYFDHVERTTKGILYLKQRRRENNRPDGVCVTEETYPFRPDWRELFRRPSSLYEDFFEAAFDTAPLSVMAQ